MFRPADEQLKILCAGAVQIETVDELRKKLEESRAAHRPLRVKLGMDPTAPDIHLGHTVVLRKMREFQDLGHKAVLIIGDYTAMIGDPSGKTRTRPMLAPEAIKRNAETYFQQAGKVLDTAPDKLEIRYNSEWLAGMSFADVLRLASHMTAAQILQRRDFKERLQNDVDIALSEFLYPLMQGWDSVVVRADVELGGTDQLFNNLVGRELQRDEKQESQVVMVMPILPGLDGVQKMSKSLGNYIGVSEPPNEVFGKAMSISDELMWGWYEMLLGKTQAEIAALKAGHPMEAKKTLAAALVERFHGAEAAQAARDHFDNQFSKKKLDEVAEPLAVPAGKIGLIELVEKTGAFKSRGDIRRIIQEGGVQLDGQKLTDPKVVIEPRAGQILRAGKRVVRKIELAG
ncbi:MAG: tyrosine--tRNA ligase [Verrucomicrobia bacterium]|nr:tyrosine--tRNA ligase [Verrucomicrobiota bacterium]